VLDGSPLGINVHSVAADDAQRPEPLDGLGVEASLAQDRLVVFA